MRGKEGRLVENSGTITIMGRSHNLYEMSDREIEELIRGNNDNPVKVKQLNDFLYKRRFGLVARYEGLNSKEDRANRLFFRDLLRELGKALGGPFSQILSEKEKKIFVYYVLYENMPSLDEIGVRFDIQTRGENELKNKTLICHILDLCHQALRKLYPDRFAPQEGRFCPKPTGNRLAQIEIDKRLTDFRKRVLKEDLKAALRESSGGGVVFVGGIRQAVIPPEDGDGEKMIPESQVKVSRLDEGSKGLQGKQEIEEPMEAKEEEVSDIGEESPGESSDIDTGEGSVVSEGRDDEVEEERIAEKRAWIKETIERLREEKETPKKKVEVVSPLAVVLTGGEKETASSNLSATLAIPLTKNIAHIYEVSRRIRDANGYLLLRDLNVSKELSNPVTTVQMNALLSKGFWERVSRGRYKVIDKSYAIKGVVIDQESVVAVEVSDSRTEISEATASMTLTADSHKKEVLLGEEVIGLMGGKKGRKKLSVSMGVDKRKRGASDLSPTEQKIVMFSLEVADEEGYFDLKEVAKKLGVPYVPLSTRIVKKGYWDKVSYGRYRLTAKARGAGTSTPTTTPIPTRKIEGQLSQTEQKMVDFAGEFADEEGYFAIGEVAKKAGRAAVPEAASIVKKGYWEKTEIRGRYRLTEKARGADVGNPTIKREGGDDRSPEVIDIKLNLQQRLEELNKEREGIEKILQVINLAEGTDELRLILELAENPRAVEALQSLLEAS